MAENNETMTVELVEGAPASEQREALRELTAAAQAADGSPPFGDQTWVELNKNDAAAAPLVIAYAWVPANHGSRGRLAGAGVVVLGGTVLDGAALGGAEAEDPESAAGETAPHVLELAVHPEWRQRGVATEIATALSLMPLANHPGAALRAWAHGGHPGGPRLAARFGWHPVRELWQMRLENHVKLPAAELPQQVRLRSFRPGQDDQAWVAANAEAFADHPEQGRLTIDDLHARMAEDWFSAEGFLLAEEAGRLLGFHWTKLHTEDGERLGEVYAVGVVPAAQGRRLGAALTVAGIEHLRQQQVAAVILYVDAENTAAAGLYTKLGFSVQNTDVQYAPDKEVGASRPRGAATSGTRADASASVR
ncbi:mycothiol synthase, partial [Nesterenkonia muleiensis]|uniref:mycothiol synthase n=1 Tax=Nesterenkonia muleiensis TaxID=2282648 RepID=UPI001EE4A448